MAIIHVNKENFEEIIVKGDKPVLADFFATWCGPCKMLSPILEQIEQEMGDRVVVAKIDIDECMDIAQQYGIMSVPTMILFQNGAEIERAVGFRQKTQIEELIKNKLD
ncbi:MAG: thioredoxin [Clostridia bacterium]|nr:thioredoxin [Clostridia bacterium]